MKVFTKRFLSFVLISMMLFSIIPLSASAATDILVVDVYDVSTPVEGEAPDYGIYLPESYHDVANWNGDGFSNGIRWKDEFGNILDPENDVFIYGVSYTVEINLIAGENNSYISVRDVAIDDEKVEYTVSDDNRIITLYKTFKTLDNEDLCAIICDYGFDNNFDFILNEVGTIPRTPEYIDRDGYTLLGWYTEPEFINEYDFMDAESSNITLYARYVLLEDLVTIYMYTDDPEFPFSIADAVIGDYVNVPDPDPYDTGMFFTGWYADKELTEKYDFSKPIEGDVYLYARLIAYDDVATVCTYMPDEYFYTDCYEVEKGNYIYIEDPEIEDMYFDGWYYDRGYENPYNPELPITDDTSLFAKFIPLSEMHVVSIWLSPEDEFPIGSGYVKDGELYEIEDPAQEGMIFEGWFSEPEFINKIDVPFTVTDDMDIYAKFVPERISHNITLYMYPNTDPVITISIYDGDYYTPAEPGIEGKVFMGWYTDPEFINEYDYAPVTSDLNLYAKFVAEEDLCTVTLFVFSDTDPLISLGIEKGTQYKPAQPGMEGMVFEGWYTEPEHINKVEMPFTVTSDINLYAYFIPAVDYILGDANSDGKVNILDATFIQRHLVGFENSINKDAADVDGDGEITVLDATTIQRFLAGFNNII